jgi:hypothetical protein
LDILNNEYFDILYSVLYYIDSVSGKIRKKLIELLQMGFNRLRQYISVRKLGAFAKERVLSVGECQDPSKISD